jgi:hypothetical protein
MVLSVAHPLDGASAKMDAAGEHFDALKSDMLAYLGSDPYTLSVEFDQRDSCFRLFNHVLREPPLKISTRIGDVVHNFASALDHTAYELACLRAGRAVERTSFPIFADIRHYRQFRRARTCWLRCLTIRDRAFLQRLQPYRGGDTACVHPLVQLYRLWNQDKHRVLNTTLAVISDYGLNATALQDVASMGPMHTRLGPIKDGAEVVRLDVRTSGPSPQVKFENDLTLHVAFEDGLIVHETLAGIGVWVQEIIRKIATQFP